MNRILTILLVLFAGLGLPSESSGQPAPPGNSGPAGRGPVSSKQPSETESLASAVSKLPQGERPILRGGVPMVFHRDLDGDGRQELLLLTVVTPLPEKSAFSHLSDFRRLFDPESEVLPFRLEVFFHRNGGWTRNEAVDLGSRKGCSAFEELPYLGPAEVPYGLSVRFPTLEGSEHVWILFSRPEKPAIFTFYEKIGVKAFLRDLDGNGKTDLLLFEDVFEDSSGHETYITWYRWDGTTYRKHRTTNLLRNLRTFLRTGKELLIAEKWKAFLDYALPAWKAAPVKKEGPQKVLTRLFKPLRFGEENTPAAEPFLFDVELLKDRIADIVFPEVLENPFPLRNGGVESFVLTARLVLPGEPHFFSLRLALDPNPFSEKMFFFILD